MNALTFVGSGPIGLSAAPLNPVFDLSAPSAMYEGDSGTTIFLFTVTLTDGGPFSSRVDYAVSGSGANPANAADFGGTLPSGTLVFAEGETSKTILLSVTGDTTAEADEEFQVTLSNAIGATIQTGTAISTILNDDAAPVPSFAVSAPSSASEGDSGSTIFTFTVTRSTSTTGTQTLDYAVTGSGANPASATDFTGDAFPSGTIQFDPGVTTITIDIPVKGDATVESNEGFTLTISNASAGTISVASGATTIINDDSGGGNEPTTEQSSVVINGVTITNYDSLSGGSPANMAVGYGAEGQAFILNDRQLYLETDLPSQVLNSYWAYGTMVNPDLSSGQGWDELLSTNGGGTSQGAATCSWQTAKNVDPGFTGARISIAPGATGSYAKSIRRTSVTAPLSGGDWRHFSNYCIWHVIPQPATGAYMPSVILTDKTIRYTKATRNLSALPTAFTLPGSFPTLASLKTINFLKEWIPIGVGVGGEIQRRLMVDETGTITTTGYTGGSDGWGIYLARIMIAMLAAGPGAFDEQTLNRLVSIAINVEGEWIQKSGAGRSYGAGQWQGYMPALALLTHLFHGIDATILDRFVAMLSNLTNQNAWADPAQEGIQTPWPGNHGVYCSTLRSEQIYVPIWRKDSAWSNFDTALDADYMFTAGVACFAEFLAIGLLQNGPSGWDGTQTLANTTSTWDTTNPRASIGAYYDRIRSVNSGVYYLTPHQSAERDLYDLVRDSFAQPRWTGVPDALTPYQNFTSTFLGTGGVNGQFTWDWRSAANATEAITAWQTQYSLDGIFWVDVDNQVSNGTQTGLIAGRKYYVRFRRQSASGWGPWSQNFPHKNVSPENGERLVIVTQGTPSGTVTNTIPPALYVKVYPACQEPYYTPAVTPHDFTNGIVLYKGVGLWTGVLGAFSYEQYRDGSPLSANAVGYTLTAADLSTTQTAVVTNTAVNSSATSGIAIPARPAVPSNIICDADWTKIESLLYWDAVFASFVASSNALSSVNQESITTLGPDGETPIAFGHMIGYKNGGYPRLSGNLAAQYPSRVVVGVPLRLTYTILVGSEVSYDTRHKVGKNNNTQEYSDITTNNVGKPKTLTTVVNFTPTDGANLGVYVASIIQTSIGSTPYGNPRYVSHKLEII